MSTLEWVFVIILSVVACGRIISAKDFYIKLPSYYTWSKYQDGEIISFQDLEDKRKQLAYSKF